MHLSETQPSISLLSDSSTSCPSSLAAASLCHLTGLHAIPPSQSVISHSKTNCDSGSTIARPSRTRTYTFRSLKDANALDEIFKCLVNGSVLKTISLLAVSIFSNSLADGIRKCVEIEVKGIIREPDFTDTSCNALLNTDFKKMASILRNKCPLLWATLTAAAGNDTCRGKILVSSSILLQERNLRCNKIQYINSLMMHQSCLQKEGLIYLNQIGISVSYDSLQRKLNEAKVLPGQSVLRWKEDI